MSIDLEMLKSLRRLRPLDTLQSFEMLRDQEHDGQLRSLEMLRSEGSRFVRDHVLCTQQDLEKDHNVM